MLAFPLWWFQPNNYGNPDLKMRDMIDTLPKEFYTTARITRPYVKLTIDRLMFITFVILESSVLLFILAVLLYLWIATPPLPKISSYPLVDFAFKAKELEHSGDGFGPLSQYMVVADNEDIRHNLGRTRITIRESDNLGDD